MYRHLSPKTGPKQDLPFKTKNQVPQSPSNADHDSKPLPPKQKDIKTLNSFLTNNQLSANPVKVTTFPRNAPNFTNSSDNLKPPPKKNGSAFDDYYERNYKLDPARRRNEDVSNSGDSYQSQGYKGVKKPFAPKWQAGKPAEKHKNLVVAPLITNQQLRNGFKSPGNKPQRTALEEDSGKRVGSFGGKKAGIGKFLEDSNRKEMENIEYKIAYKFGANALPFPGLNLSNQPSKPDHKLEQQKSEKQKSNKSNVPKFLLNGNIKSSPYLNKYALDSSNEHSDSKLPKLQKAKVLPLLEQLKRQKEKQEKKRRTDEEKSLSFNKGEMFSNLKKRQEMHSLLTKEINVLGVTVELSLIAADGRRSVAFLLVKKINESKNTAIFLACHPPTNSLYCLKRIACTQSKTLPQMIQQHKIHQLCSHPHLVKYFFTALDTSHLYLGMQYLQSETLGHELKHQVLKNMSEQNATWTKNNETFTSQISKINRIRKILYEITTAVAYLHEKGIIHRDIKPENIFVSHDTYKLGDFGSAGLEGALEYIGTLDYAAPEILTQSPYNHKIDIWSLGCIAYQLDVGRPPFFHINQQQTKKFAIKGEYDKSLICDSQLRKLVQQMLVVNAKGRLSAGELLKNEFFARLEQDKIIF